MAAYVSRDIPGHFHNKTLVFQFINAVSHLLLGVAG